MLLIGKPSISMGHLYHGYVSHNQRVTPSWCGTVDIFLVNFTWSRRLGMGSFWVYHVDVEAADYISGCGKWSSWPTVFSCSIWTTNNLRETVQCLFCLISPSEWSHTPNIKHFLNGPKYVISSTTKPWFLEGVEHWEGIIRFPQGLLTSCWDVMCK